MLVEKNLKEALEYYIKGKPVTALWIGEDGGMNAMPLSDILDQPENHFLVDVPAVHETQESITPPPNGAGGKDGRRNDRSSGGQYRR